MCKAPSPQPTITRCLARSQRIAVTSSETSAPIFRNSRPLHSFAARDLPVRRPRGCRGAGREPSRLRSPRLRRALGAVGARAGSRLGWIGRWERWSPPRSLAAAGSPGATSPTPRATFSSCSRGSAPSLRNRRSCWSRLTEGPLCAPGTAANLSARRTVR